MGRSPWTSQRPVTDRWVLVVILVMGALAVWAVTQLLVKTRISTHPSLIVARPAEGRLPPPQPAEARVEAAPAPRVVIPRPAMPQAAPVVPSAPSKETPTPPDEPVQSEDESGD